MRRLWTSKVGEGNFEMVSKGREGKHCVGLRAAIREEGSGGRVGVKESVKFAGFVAV